MELARRTPFLLDKSVSQSLSFDHTENGNANQRLVAETSRCLGRSPYSEFAHLGLKCRTIQAKSAGRTVLSTHHPVGLVQDTNNVRAL
jgi:hypothetical protein